MNNNKPQFEMHARFRNGVFLLAILLFGSVLLYYFYPKTRVSKENFVELTKFQHQIDSLKQIVGEEKKVYKLKPFNPNFISDYKGYQLGLSATALDRLAAYRNQGKWINSVSDFKNVTKVSDSLLVTISPLFKFPEWVKNSNTKRKNAKKKYPIISYNKKEDLNTATAEQLREKVNVPDFIAQRIVNYRSKIGGFVDDIQLKDVSGLYEIQRQKMHSLFTVKTPKAVTKVNINTASVDELIEVPYFDFEMVLEIRDYIKNKGSISSFEELEKINGFSLEKIDRITLYLTLD